MANWVCEYWHSDTRLWVPVDPDISSEIIPRRGNAARWRTVYRGAARSVREPGDRSAATPGAAQPARDGAAVGDTYVHPSYSGQQPEAVRRHLAPGPDPGG